MLDVNGGHAGNYCEAPIICDTQNGTIDKKLSFYYIAHFGQYILPGAKRSPQHNTPPIWRQPLFKIRTVSSGSAAESNC